MCLFHTSFPPPPPTFIFWGSVISPTFIFWLQHHNDLYYVSSLKWEVGDGDEDEDEDETGTREGAGQCGGLHDSCSCDVYMMVFKEAVAVTWDSTKLQNKITHSHLSQELLIKTSPHACMHAWDQLLYVYVCVMILV